MYKYGDTKEKKWTKKRSLRLFDLRIIQKFDVRGFTKHWRKTVFFLESRVTTKLWACSDVPSNLAGIFCVGLSQWEFENDHKLAFPYPIHGTGIFTYTWMVGFYGKCRSIYHGPIEWAGHVTSGNLSIFVKFSTTGVTSTCSVSD